MTQNVRNHAHMLKVLSESSPRLRKSILQHADSNLVKCLCECSLNVLKGNVSLSPHQKRKLSRHKQKLRALANPKLSKAKKKKLLIQQGGFVGALIGPVLSTLAGLLLK